MFRFFAVLHTSQWSITASVTNRPLLYSQFPPSLSYFIGQNILKNVEININFIRFTFIKAEGIPGKLATAKTPCKGMYQAASSPTHNTRLVIKLKPFTLPTSLSAYTLRKLYFYFLSNRMGYGSGDSFPFDFEPNRIKFCLKQKEKLSPQPYPIRFERKQKYSFLSAENPWVKCVTYGTEFTSVHTCRESFSESC